MDQVDDLPLFEDYQMTGRTYRFFRGKLLFLFGFGLSHSTFQFKNLRTDRTEVVAGARFLLALM
jgi:beta-glucosidase